MQATLHNSETYSAPSSGNISSSESFGAIAPLLDLALTESNAQGAYLHHFDRLNSAACLVVWSGRSPIAAAVSLEVHGTTVRTHFERYAPMVLQEGAWSHYRFEMFAEFRKNRFEGVVSIPLVDSGNVVGMLDICRSYSVGWQPRDFSFLLNLSVPIGALLAASAARLSLEREVEKLTRQLADRKLFERAKGLIQSRFEWTEEQAYFCLRNLSRRLRTPMREVALEIIGTAASGVSREEASDEA